MADEHHIGFDESPPGPGLRSSRSTSKLDVPDIIFDSEHTLSIEQRLTSNGRQGGRKVRVSGHLDIRSSEKHSNTGRIEIEFGSEDATLTAATSIKKSDEQNILISTPSTVDWWERKGPEPCVKIHIIVYAPIDGNIKALALTVDSLSVSIAEDLKLNAADMTTITTTSGNVTAPSLKSNSRGQIPHSLQSRQIIVQTVSGNVEGWLPLHHLLKVKSVSGNLSIDVGLESAYPNSRTNAKLMVESVSGKVIVREPYVFYAQTSKQWKMSDYKNQPPVRDYVVAIVTASGDIDAQVAMTSSTSIRSASGNLRLDVAVVRLPSSRGSGGSLETDIRSGTTEVLVVKSLINDVNGLQSHHQSMSGRIKVGYPERWTGKFSAATLGGTILVNGQDMRITRSSHGTPKRLEGLRGDGPTYTSSVRMNSTAGDIIFRLLADASYLK
ncbi:hypothetical protein E4U47_000052 [Claviceps purpurea]|nr:hypothetical protein E4U11_005900 [Claviceps purpurea]KAG6189237.1 hypothetical protein E4U36_005560 [Claviceps purpurea]KAG6270451.1 hypothetical protein E4U49_005473 [Claviceps purpurea]KAG6281189.1 hypothetical protein E4U47_000052 [Claviceps purpurea]KAG6322335.1 hypothetical protein E4U44_004124 [Claviceps purpurea]